MSQEFIMIVEDNPDDVELVRAGLAQTTSTPLVVFTNGKAALDFLFRTGEYASREETYPNLILLDGELTDIQGITLLHRIREFKPTKITPVVIYTGAVSDEDKPTFYAAGANVFIRKTEDFSAVARFLVRAGWVKPT